MSCFLGRMQEYERVSLDRFDAKNLHSTVYFLSHLHEDHTSGLALPIFWNRLKTNHDIFLYCSEVTKVLIGASQKYKHLLPFVKSLPINSPTTIAIPDPLYDEKEVVTVTFLPAFHCPGSVMCLFEGHEGTVLYTGDFRWEHFQLEQMHHLRSGQSVKPIKSLYVDTTFFNMNTLYIPSRQHCIDAVYQLVREWIQQSPDHMVYISLRAQYGHEPLLNGVATRLNKKIHVSGHKMAVYEHIKEFSGNFTTDSRSTQIHACGKEVTTTLDGVSLSCFASQPRDKMLIILPTTMYFTQFQHLSLDRIVRRVGEGFYRACYSFHSSYTEIRDLVSYLRPTNVYPNVIAVGDGSLSVTQHRLNTMLKECTAQAAADVKAINAAGDSGKKLGKLKVQCRQQTRKRKDTESDTESLDFGTPVKSRRVDPSPPEVTPVSGSKRGRGRGRGRGKGGASPTPPEELNTRSSTRLRTRRSAATSPQADVDTAQMTPKKRLRPTTPELFTPVKDDSDNDSSYAGSNHSDSEMDLTCSQKSVEFGASGEEIPSFESSVVWKGSFLAAVGSSVLHEGSSSLCVMKHDGDQTDLFFQDVSQIIDDDEGIPSVNMKLVDDIDVNESNVEKNEMKADDCVHQSRKSTVQDNATTMGCETGETKQTIDVEIADDISKCKLDVKITQKGRKSLNRKANQSKRGKSGELANVATDSELEQNKETVKQTTSIPSANVDETYKNASKDVSSHPDANLQETSTVRRSGRQRKSTRKYEEESDCAVTPTDTLGIHKDVPVKDSSPTVKNNEKNINKSPNIALKKRVGKKQKTSSSDIEVICDEQGDLQNKPEDIQAQHNEIVKSDKLSAEPIDNRAKHEGAVISQSTAAINTEGLTRVEQSSTLTEVKKLPESSSNINSLDNNSQKADHVKMTDSTETTGISILDEKTCDKTQAVNLIPMEKQGTESREVIEVIEKETSDVSDTSTTNQKSATELPQDCNQDKLIPANNSKASIETSGNTSQEISSRSSGIDGQKVSQTNQDDDTEPRHQGTGDHHRSSIDSTDILTVNCEETVNLVTNDDSAARHAAGKNTCDEIITKTSVSVSGMNVKDTNEDLSVNSVGGKGDLSPVHIQQEFISCGDDPAVHTNDDPAHTVSQSRSFEETQPYNWDSDEDPRNDDNCIIDKVSVNNGDSNTDNFSDIDSDCEILDLQPAKIEIDLTYDVDESEIESDGSVSETDKSPSQNFTQVSQTSSNASPSKVKKLRFVRRSSFDLTDGNPKDSSVDDLFSVTRRPAPIIQPPDIDWSKYIEPQKDIGAEYYKFLSEISGKESTDQESTCVVEDDDCIITYCDVKIKAESTQNDDETHTMTKSDSADDKESDTSVKSKTKSNPGGKKLLHISFGKPNQKGSRKAYTTFTERIEIDLENENLNKDVDSERKRDADVFLVEDNDTDQPSAVDSPSQSDINIDKVPKYVSVESNEPITVQESSEENGNGSKSPGELVGNNESIVQDYAKHSEQNVANNEITDSGSTKSSNDVQTLTTTRVINIDATCSSGNVANAEVINLDSSQSSDENIVNTDIVNLISTQSPREKPASSEPIDVSSMHSSDLEKSFNVSKKQDTKKCDGVWLSSSKAKKGQTGNNDTIEIDSDRNESDTSENNTCNNTNTIDKDENNAENQWLFILDKNKRGHRKTPIPTNISEVEMSDSNSTSKLESVECDVKSIQTKILKSNTEEDAARITGNVDESGPVAMDIEIHNQPCASTATVLSDDTQINLREAGADIADNVIICDSDELKNEETQPPENGRSPVRIYDEAYLSLSDSDSAVEMDFEDVPFLDDGHKGKHKRKIKYKDAKQGEMKNNDKFTNVVKMKLPTTIEPIVEMVVPNQNVSKSVTKEAESTVSKGKWEHIQQNDEEDADLIQKYLAHSWRGDKKMMHRAKNSKHRADRVKQSIDVLTKNKRPVSKRTKRTPTSFLSRHAELRRIKSVHVSTDTNVKGTVSKVRGVKGSRIGHGRFSEVPPPKSLSTSRNLRDTETKSEKFGSTSKSRVESGIVTKQNKIKDQILESACHDYQTAVVKSISNRKVSIAKKNIPPPGVAFPILYKNIPPPSHNPPQSPLGSNVDASANSFTVPPPSWPNLRTAPCSTSAFISPASRPNPFIVPPPLTSIALTQSMLATTSQHLSTPIAFTVPPPALPSQSSSSSNLSTNTADLKSSLEKYCNTSQEQTNPGDVRKLVTSVLQNVSSDPVVQSIIDTALKCSINNVSDTVAEQDIQDIQESTEMSQFPRVSNIRRLSDLYGGEISKNYSQESPALDSEESGAYNRETPVYQPEGSRRYDVRFLPRPRSIEDDRYRPHARYEPDEHHHSGPPFRRDDPLYREDLRMDDDLRRLEEYDRLRHTADLEHQPRAHSSYPRDPHHDPRDPYHDPRNPYHDPRDPYHDPRDPHHDPRDPYHDPRDPYHDPRDRHHDPRDPHHDPRDPHHDPRDPYHDRLDPYDPYHVRRDPYDRRDMYYHPRDPYHDPLDPSHDPRDPFHDRIDLFDDRRDPYPDRRDRYHNRRDPYHDRRDPYHDRHDPNFGGHDPFYDRRKPRVHSPDPRYSHDDPHRDQPHHKPEVLASQRSISSDPHGPYPLPPEREPKLKPAHGVYRPGIGMEHPEDSLSRQQAKGPAIHNAHSTDPLVNVPTTEQNFIENTVSDTSALKGTWRNTPVYPIKKPKLYVVSRSRKCIAPSYNLSLVTDLTTRTFKQSAGATVNQSSLKSESATNAPAFVTGLTNFSGAWPQVKK